ncbi:MAG: hypothetical protein KA956_10985 [Pyrinomonadaceae bacterium]|nr:hypothetical protein [Acidobacteriota bacterium]MBP7376989.1 hypothetical protein [Pyrinomonadaceae bacterium]
MSSWACQSGGWSTFDCVTTPGATFTHPITLNIYNVGPANSVGSLITSVTQTFSIPYRPSADLVNCTGGRWYQASTGTCFNGYAANITFNLTGLAIPNEVIYGIAYNTSNYGYTPIGTMPCSATSEGCPYDSLNVALEGVTSVGVNPDPDSAYFNTLTAGWYCDNGVGGVGSFRLDSGCWTGYKPSVRFATLNIPANANQCKNNGWQTRTRADGTLFRNQGDCIQYVNTGK